MPPNPEQIYMASELNASIEDQISALPPRIQATFRLRKIEEFSISEAARALGIRETAVKSRVSRARGKVARGLRKLLSTPPPSHSPNGSSVQQRLNRKSASLRQLRPNFAQSRKPWNALKPSTLSQIPRVRSTLEALSLAALSVPTAPLLCRHGPSQARVQ